MTANNELGSTAPDPAAVFACAFSLWQAVSKHALTKKLNLGEIYNGMDQLMREIMRIATGFEAWACRHVAFGALDDVWPYLLQDHFGDVCLDLILPDALTSFDESDCLRVALGLRLPLRLSGKLPIPVDLVAANPVPGSPFREFRIQTVRNSADGEDVVPFTPDDDPYDEQFGPPYFGLYGVGEDGVLEHLADRRTYPEVMSLAQKLAPGICFPVEPTSICRSGSA